MRGGEIKWPTHEINGGALRAVALVYRNIIVLIILNINSSTRRRLDQHRSSVAESSEAASFEEEAALRNPAWRKAIARRFFQP